MILKNMITQPYFYLCLITIHSSSLYAARDQLFDQGLNRGKVEQVAYAYYPETKELRIQLMLENRARKYGRFRNDSVINHLLPILIHADTDLYCAYEGQSIKSIGRYSNSE